GDRQLPLAAAQIEITETHFGEHRDERVATRFDTGFQFGLRGFNGPACASEHVELPAHVRAELEEVVLQRLSGCGELSAVERVLALLGAGVVNASVDLRKQDGTCDASQRPRFTHAGPGEADIEVRSCGL